MLALILECKKLLRIFNTVFPFLSHYSMILHSIFEARVARRWMGFTSDRFSLRIGVSVTRRLGNSKYFGGRNRSENQSEVLRFAFHLV